VGDSHYREPAWSNTWFRIVQNAQEREKVPKELAVRHRLRPDAALIRTPAGRD
jgi:hypothetical protein